MLAVLPGDIVRSVVLEYFPNDLHAWSRIDVAFCNRSIRAEWRSILAQEEVTFQQVMQDPVVLVGYLQWIAKRNVPIKWLLLDPHVMEAADGGLQLELGTVTQIAFHNTEPNENVDAASMATFLSCFPSITEFSLGSSDVRKEVQPVVPGWTNIQDKHLMALCMLHCPLKVVDLWTCEQVSAAMTAHLVSRFAPTNAAHIEVRSTG